MTAGLPGPGRGAHGRLPLPVATLLALGLLGGAVWAEDEDRALASVSRPAAAAASAPPLRPVGQPLSRQAERLDWQRRHDSPAHWSRAPWTPADAALLAAARQGRWPEVAALLKPVDAPVNPRDAQGDHLLALAARAGQDEIVRGLLQRGADIDRMGGDGFTALGAAAFAGQRSTVRLLLRLGADPAVHGAGGQPALHLAAAAGQLDVVDEFVRQRVDLELLNKQRETALDLAATKGQQDVMDRLMKAGADLSRAGQR